MINSAFITQGYEQHNFYNTNILQTTNLPSLNAGNFKVYVSPNPICILARSTLKK